MERMKILWILTFCFLFTQEAMAGADQPSPVFESVYVTEYEQWILGEVISGRSAHALQLLLAGGAGMNKVKEKEFRSQIASFVHKMERKKTRAGSDKIFLQKLFYKVHRKFLKEYQPYQDFYSLLENGSYNCLSGTAMYALLLEELGYTYRIYETDYHIFLMIETAGGEQVMIESTDPLNGFLIDESEIKRRTEEIRKDISVAGNTGNKAYHDFQLNIFRSINLKQLSGLQYLNQAAWHFNARQLDKARNALGKGRLLYPAERFEKFSGYLTSVR